MTAHKTTIPLRKPVWPWVGLSLMPATPHLLGRVPHTKRAQQPMGCLCNQKDFAYIPIVSRSGGNFKPLHSHAQGRRLARSGDRPELIRVSTRIGSPHLSLPQAGAESTSAQIAPLTNLLYTGSAKEIEANFV